MTILLSALLFPLVASAQQAPPPPIVGGTETSEYLPVGSLVLYHESYGAQGFCSGTLAAEAWVVTAAHCIEAAQEYAGYGFDILFCTGTDIYDRDGIEECDLAIDLVSHPDYDGDQLQNDIGVVELSTGLRASGSYALNDDAPSTFADDTVTYVGWGITDDGRNDSGQKRTVEIPIYDFDGQFLYTFDPTGQANLCSGDSGGAALMWSGGGWELIGVNSFVGSREEGAPCGGENAFAGVARVDAYYDWLVSYTGTGDTGGGDDTGGGGDDTGTTGDDTGTTGGDDTAAPEDTGEVEDTAAPDDGGGGKGGLSEVEGIGCSAAGGAAPGRLGLGLALGLLGLAMSRRRSPAG